MGYDIEGVGRSVEHLAHKVSSLTDAVTDNVKEDKESSMNDIAGLLALMQGNKGMDLPGLLALCKEKGYDTTFGNSFMFVFLLFFLLVGGGWNSLGRNNQEAFAAMAGNNCQDIIGLHDRIADARSVSQLGFQQLQTWLCESIANVTSTIRNQNEGTLVAVNNVGSVVRDCCCKLEAELAALTCKVDGLGRDIRETGNLINAKIELEALKQTTAMQAMETRLSQQQKDCCCEMNQRFDRLECTIQTNRMADENARLSRENEALRSTLQGQKFVSDTVNQLETFVLNHFNPTKTAASATA